jgi:predicted Zn-dependent protease
MLLMAAPLPAIAAEGAAASAIGPRLWQLAAKEQMALEQRGAVLNDPSLGRYLQDVVNRLWRQAPVRMEAPTVKVIMDTRIDAHAYPNGVCYLSTGMLDIMENESQLAMILAHEMVHYARQHAVAFYNHFVSGAPPIDDRHARPGAMQGGLAMRHRLDEAERQADREGIAMMRAAGYCDAQVLPLMSNLMRRMMDLGYQEHTSQLEQRSAFFREQVGSHSGQAACNASTVSLPGDFRARLAPALLANAQNAIRQGEWQQAHTSISAFLTVKPAHAQAHYLKGEILRRRSRGDRNEACLGSYRQALKIDPTFPLAHRALGEWYFRAKRYEKARPHFEAFLDLAPGDHSQAFIKGYLQQCIN